MEYYMKFGRRSDAYTSQLKPVLGRQKLHLCLNFQLLQKFC